ncbi:MAG: hypothetical protein ACKPCM_11610, partial [Pseudanabaena sp.]
DFKINFEGNDYYIECKSFATESPETLLRRDQLSALRQNIDLEEQQKTGQSISMADRVSTSYDYDKKNASPSLKPLYIIQRKINSNLKPNQLNKDRTMLFIDVGLLGLGETGTESLQPFVFSTQYENMWNGTLWTLCCGKEGMPVFGCGSLYENSYGVLEFDGIFHSHPDVISVIFRCDSNEKLVAVTKRSIEDASFELLEKLGVYIRAENDNRILPKPNMI